MTRTFVVKSLIDGHTIEPVRAARPSTAIKRARRDLHREDDLCGLYSKNGKVYYGTLNLVPTGTTNHYQVKL